MWFPNCTTRVDDVLAFAINILFGGARLIHDELVPMTHGPGFQHVVQHEADEQTIKSILLTKPTTTISPQLSLFSVDAGFGFGANTLMDLFTSHVTGSKNVAKTGCHGEARGISHVLWYWRAVGASLCPSGYCQ